MKGRSLVAAIVIVIASLASFVVWQTGEHQRLDVDDIGFFKKQQQSLVVQYGKRLFWLAPDKQLIKQLDTSELGLNAVGDYDFFANRDLLVYHRVKPLTLVDNIKAYLRLSSDKQLNHSTKLGDDGFYRCQLANNQCVRFGDQLPLIKRGFRLVIHQADNTIYLADTSAHLLYKISPTGRVIATSDNESFTFPNHILVVGNKLWLADTNHQRIVALNTDTDNFALQLKQVETIAGDKHQFPHQFVIENNKLWVNIADNSMSNGLIQQYDMNGQLLKTAELTHIRDPLAMVSWQNKLLVADFITAQIEQVNLQGESLGLFNIPVLQESLEQRELQVQEALLISQYGQIGFSITLILGFIAPWKLEGKGRKTDKQNSAFGSSAQNTEQADINNINELGVLWVTNNVVKYKSKIYKIGLLYVLPPLALFFSSGFDENWVQATLDFAIVYLLLTLIMLYLMNYLSKLKIGVYGNNVHLHARGKKVVAEFSELRLSTGYIFSEGFVIPVGGGNVTLFDKADFQEQVISKITTDNYFSETNVSKQLWKLKEPLFVSVLGLILVWFIF